MNVKRQELVSSREHRQKVGMNARANPQVGWRKEKWREIYREKEFAIPAAAMRPDSGCSMINPWERKDNWPKKRIAGSCLKPNHSSQLASKAFCEIAELEITGNRALREVAERESMARTKIWRGI
jgi:hypothetical protein